MTVEHQNALPWAQVSAARAGTIWKALSLHAHWNVSTTEASGSLQLRRVAAAVYRMGSGPLSLASARRSRPYPIMYHVFPLCERERRAYVAHG